MSTHTCPRHGEYADTIGGEGYALQPTCPACEREAQAVEHAYRRQCAVFNWWQQHSGIPSRYRNRGLDNWQTHGNQAAARTIRRYVDQLTERIDQGRGLLLLGPPGVGKTHLMAAIVNAACAAGIRGRYAVWPDLIGRVRAAFKARANHPDRDVLDQAATAPLLALDELAVTAGTDWERGQLFELVDHRYRENLATLIASNATRGTLPDLVGERLADRLREMTAAVLLSGDSRRGHVEINDPPALSAPPDDITITVTESGRQHECIIRNPYRESTP